MAVTKEKHEMTQILAEAGIRPSPVRILILGELYQSGRPLSSLEIETMLDTVDRSSITRTLSLFADRHIIHVIPDGSGSMKYEICHDTARHSQCSVTGHSDEHAHFHCRICGMTTCLDNVHVGQPELPDGYHAENVSYIVTGICPACSARQTTSPKLIFEP